MGIVDYLFGPGMFFAPFIYIFLYLCIERGCSRHLPVQAILKTITVLGGIALIIHAFTAPLDFAVLMPSRGAAKHGVPAAYFLVIVGVVLLTLPLYSKYIKFSNSSE